MPIMPGMGLFNMFGGNRTAQTGQSAPTFDIDLRKEAALPPEKQGQAQQITYEQLMQGQPSGPSMRNTEPSIDPITGKPEIYTGQMAQAPNTPNTAGAEKAQMFSQLGDPKKAMGSIWDQIKGVGGGIKKGLGALDAKMEANIKEAGYSTEPDKPEAPWSVKSIPKENWENWEMGVLQNPHEMNEESLMKLAMGDDGQLDQSRWNMIKDHIEGSKGNPYVKKNMAPKGSSFYGSQFNAVKKMLGMDN